MSTRRPLTLTLALAASLWVGQTYAAHGPADASFSAGLTFVWPWSGAALSSEARPLAPPVFAQELDYVAWIGLPGGVAPVGSVNLVPEPHRWATLLTGFGLVILALRRRIRQ